jgi:hypothetical protein
VDHKEVSQKTPVLGKDAIGQPLAVEVSYEKIDEEGKRGYQKEEKV